MLSKVTFYVVVSDCFRHWKDSVRDEANTRNDVIIINLARRPVGPRTKAKGQSFFLVCRLVARDNNVFNFMNSLRVVCLEPELEDGEVKYCPDCAMVLDPFLTYCPMCGTLARVRQAHTEAARLMLGRYTVLTAGVFSLLSIFLNFAIAIVAAEVFGELSRINQSSAPVAKYWFLQNVALVFVVMSLLLCCVSFVGTVYSYEAGHKRWNPDRLRVVVFSARLLIFLGSINLLLGFVFQGIRIPIHTIWETGALMIPPLLWVTSVFIILLSLPGLIIATRWLKREEAEAGYVLS